MNEKNIFVLLIGGIPGGGKTYLSNKIISEYQNIYEIKYLNFDLIENINKDNYLQYQQMRNDYLLKIQEIFDNEINYFANNNTSNNNSNNKSLLIILDDNFFLKSMRKKIYNAILDKIFHNSNNLCKIYYVEILLKLDINYCLKMNSKRNSNQKIPNDIIINMNNIFEYKSPYINSNQNIIFNINNENDLKNINLIKEIFNNKEKYIIKQKEEIKTKIIIEKDNKAKLIDDIEDIIRKEINNILKKNEKNKKRGKEISVYKKEYMKIIINIIKHLKQNDNNDNNIVVDKNTEIYKLLNECITNNIFNISQNEQFIGILKDDFMNFLLQKNIDK